MPGPKARFQPPFCPNPKCDFHRKSTGWRVKRIGFYQRRIAPHRIQRYLCIHCRRSFSSQTFHTTYWLKRPELLPALFWRVLSCSGYRQIAREFGVSPTTVLRQVARLGRHCWLVQEQHRPTRPLAEPLVAFTDAELRRKGRMTPPQRQRRAELEARHGRPDPKSIEREVAELVRLVVREPGAVEIRSDEHLAYPRAFRRLTGIEVTHKLTPSTRPRTPQNPLFPANLLDLLIRHNGSNHKRETIAAAERGGAARGASGVAELHETGLGAPAGCDSGPASGSERAVLDDRRPIGEAAVCVPGRIAGSDHAVLPARDRDATAPGQLRAHPPLRVLRRGPSRGVDEPFSSVVRHILRSTTYRLVLYSSPTTAPISTPPLASSKSGMQPVGPR